ncbi:MAG: tRNA (cytidine(34)-2'-O)-methyltransferase [Defluviitaleaceae bacterium]|nr:tRNA (cytidine(34)-2'-O)-methyltransferase [Defluviitaleaceae bacterium]
MNIVLYQPEIPHNTGAIGRTCLITGTKLHLIHPLAFFLDEKHLRRAGMDYWEEIETYEYANFEDFLDKNPDANIYLAESCMSKPYTDMEYKMGDYIMFGSESRGIPKEILERYPNKVISIPMNEKGRSLNLSVSAGIVLYEALRQNGFPDLH